MLLDSPRVSHPTSDYGYTEISLNSETEEPEAHPAASFTTLNEASAYDDDVALQPGQGCFRHYGLQFWGLTLHVALILLHLALLIIGIKHLEQQITFPLERQNIASFTATIISTGFTTIYCAILVFIMHDLATQRDLGKKRTLTAIHDSLAAWAGVGSALATLYNQLAVPASAFGTLRVLAYLSGISLLHITTPAILTVQTGNISVPINVSTLGVPEYNTSSNPDNLDASQTIGLFNGSLYDVLPDTTRGVGEAQVFATGFNVTCGCLRGVNTKFTPSQDVPGVFSPDEWDVLLDQAGNISIGDIGPNIIGTLRAINSSVILYTPNTVIDSHQHKGDSVILKHPMGPNSTISQLQFLQCSRTLVSQQGTIDSGSGLLNGLSLQPNFFKTH
ncbi:hypothetical protein FB451DRAFT_1206607 [Mycena latifolia]|nr:hypothetical protein FB451DRAFT_1206607 [Mycena latifolia]